MSALYSLYCAIILPYLNYCSEILGNNYNKYTRPILILQKKAIRVISGAKYRDHTLPLFNKLRLLSFPDFVKFKNLCFMYKVYTGLLPKNIMRYFTLARDSHNYSTRNHGQFEIKYRRTVLKSMSLSMRGPKLWNELPDYLKDMRSIKSFKNNCTKYLLVQYQ